MTEVLAAFLDNLRARYLLRYWEMEEAGIVTDRMTLRRWMNLKQDPFPQPLVLSGNSVAWRADEVFAWLDRRPRGRAPQPARQRAAKAVLETAVG